MIDLVADLIVLDFAQDQDALLLDEIEKNTAVKISLIFKVLWMRL